MTSRFTLLCALAVAGMVASGCGLAIDANRVFPCATDLDCADEYGCYIGYGTRFCAPKCDSAASPKEACWCDPQQSLCLRPCDSHADCQRDAACVVTDAVDGTSHCQLNLLCDLLQGEQLYVPPSDDPEALSTCTPIGCNSSDDCWDAFGDTSDHAVICSRDLRPDTLSRDEVSGVCVSLCSPTQGIECPAGTVCTAPAGTDLGYCGPSCTPSPGLPAGDPIVVDGGVVGWTEREIGCPPGFRCTLVPGTSDTRACIPSFLGTICDPLLDPDSQCDDVQGFTATCETLLLVEGDYIRSILMCNVGDPGCPADADLNALDLCTIPCDPSAATPCPTGYSCTRNPIIPVSGPPAFGYVCVPGLPIAPCETEADCTAEFYGEATSCLGIDPGFPLEIPTVCAIPCDPMQPDPCPNSLLAAGFYRLECVPTDPTTNPTSPGGCIPAPVGK